jgi:hypothetical protein
LALIASLKGAAAATCVIPAAASEPGDPLARSQSLSAAQLDNTRAGFHGLSVHGLELTLPPRSSLNQTDFDFIRRAATRIAHRALTLR